MRTSPRPCAILDLAIMIIAIGIGLYFSRECFDAEWLRVAPKTLIDRLDVSCAFVHPLLPVMLAMSLSVLVVRIRRPRPPIRIALRSPGVTACFGLAAVVLLETIQGMGSDILFDVNSGRALNLAGVDGSLWKVYWQLPQRIGHTVTVLWLVLIVTGRWRPEPNWIDRLGRFLGVFWILAGILWWFKTW